MKKTIKSWVFFALQLFFIVVVPVILVWMQYGDSKGTFKVSITAILLFVLIFYTFKKIFLTPWLKKCEMKIANIETNALSITEPLAIEKNKKAWRFYVIVQMLINSVIPILLFIGAIITIKSVEEGIIKLYGVLMFCLVSMGVGLGFKVLEIFSIRLTHE